SFSREETAACDFLESWLVSNGFEGVHRIGNNLWMESEPASWKPTILLNAHIDTVRPAGGYTRDPFTPSVEEGRLYGLGSNDDGGSLAALLEAYSVLSAKPQPYRLVFSASAEEEVCGKEGFDLLLSDIGKVDFGVIGEPTGMDMAVAERGLMVLDCTARGKSGHAAREEGVNAIYEALKDIEWFRSYRFDKVSGFLGPVKMTVTMISAGTQHNVIPDKCCFVVDVRSNGMYSNEELLGLIKEAVHCEVKERSTRIGSSHLPADHPAVLRGLSLGLKPFGSPTTSNQALSPFPTLKIGPGDSSRSHGPDEYICLEEVASGEETYVKLLDGLSINPYL
ncbi:MAG: M20/M25/M40 family metallo-hydrolase, partial [Bacteroidales bacterium]|nr:M20/M25/M40 family metallo-hydrolase [Bacteroidales bacterium]